MKARPLHDRVLLKRIEETETVKGGIIIVADYRSPGVRD
jgi:co-chaperonin GroES (HSP10)